MSTFHSNKEVIMMRSIYEDKRIPVPLRRLMAFDELCKKAKLHPDKIVHLSRFTQLAFGLIYLKDIKSYMAYGGIFEYAHTRQEGIHIIPEDELIMCALTVNLESFTKPVATPIQLLWHWNNFVKNRLHCYIDYREECFFRINDEVDEEYAPHQFHERLVATAHLPMWDDRSELISNINSTSKTGRMRPSCYENRI